MGGKETGQLGRSRGELALKMEEGQVCKQRQEDSCKTIPWQKYTLYFRIFQNY